MKMHLAKEISASSLISLSFQNWTMLCWLLLCMVATRLIPHWPNVTATLAASLLMGFTFSGPRAWLITALTTFFGLIISDFLLSLIHPHAVLGSWSWFTYSGMMVVTLMGRLWASKFNLISLAISTSLFYWFWTNYGVWLTSTIYPFSLSGLLQCYIAAIPFLGHQLIGDWVWTTLLAGAIGPALTTHSNSTKLVQI